MSKAITSQTQRNVCEQQQFWEGNGEKNCSVINIASSPPKMASSWTENLSNIQNTVRPQFLDKQLT